MVDSPAADRIIDEPLIRLLLREQAPALAELALTRAAEGWDNVTWRLGDDLAVRMPRRDASAGLIEHEQAALPHLAPLLGRGGIRTPLPVVAGVPSADFPRHWSVVPWIDGAPALGIPLLRNARWASALADGLRALHVPAPESAPRNPVRGVALAVRDAAVRRRIERLPDRDLASALGAIWQHGLDAPPAEERVWIHGDLHAGNILIHEDRLAAFIDFGDVTAGDPAYDLAICWQVFDPAGRAAFSARLAGRYDAATWARARAWAAAVAVILLDESDDRADYRALGAETARQLLGAAPVSPAPPAP